MIKYILAILLVLMTVGCATQDIINLPDNTSSTQSTAVNSTPVNTTVEVIPAPPSNILLPVQNKLGIFIMDNSNGNSFISTLGGHSLLVNAPSGADGLRNLRTLKNVGISNLDYFILTNSLDKNIGSASSIILRAKPTEVIHSGIKSTTLSYKSYNSLKPNITTVPKDITLALDDATIDLIVPYDDGLGFSADSSVVVKLNYGDFSMLFTNDCRIDCESRIDNVFSNILVSNGYCDSLDLIFLQDVSPEIVVFTSTPCQETLNRVTSLGLEVFSTPTDGDVVITSDGKTFDKTHLKVRV